MCQKLYYQEFQTAVNSCLYYRDGALEDTPKTKKYVALALMGTGLGLKLPWLWCSR